MLQPFGKKWCGDTHNEQILYFKNGILPRPQDKCHVAGRILFLDAKNKTIYTCPFSPHRDWTQKYALVLKNLKNILSCNRLLENQILFFRDNGPQLCKGCSPLAALISDNLAKKVLLNEWYL